MTAFRLSFLAAVVALGACSPPTRDGDPPACADEKTCGAACCGATESCDRATSLCVACAQTSCVAAKAECGAIDDGCGGTLACGGCPAGRTCGGGGTANVCGSGGTCVPASCEALAKTCGTIDDGCGHALHCGSCTGPATCGGGGVENVCGAADPCIANPASCTSLCLNPGAGLAFGAVTVGATSAQTLNVRNCGLLALDVTTLNLPAGQGFSMAGAPALPYHLAAGDELNLPVTFAPTQAQGYASALEIGREGHVDSVPLSGTGTPGTPACDATVRPTAALRVKKGALDITANPTVLPLDTVMFDAGTSTVPRGGATYAWRLVSQPRNGTMNVAPRANPSSASLFAELAGDYVVELTVSDSLGCASGPTRATVHAVSSGRIQIQLTWAEGFGDLDLHLLGPGGRFDDAGTATVKGTDCFYGNCKPESYDLDWGLNGTTAGDNISTNDPTLDIDALWGNGPEILSDAAPFDATYTVLVHYYCSRSRDSHSATGVSSTSQGAATASLKVDVNGVEKLVAVHALTQRDKWIAATIVVSNGGQTITVNPSTAPITKSTASIDACTADTN
jgi:hypothetical protein